MDRREESYQPRCQDLELDQHGEQARILCQARKGKQQAFDMLIVKCSGGNRPQWLLLDQSVQTEFKSADIVSGSSEDPFCTMQIAANAAKKKSNPLCQQKYFDYASCDLACLPVQRTTLFLELHWRYWNTWVPRERLHQRQEHVVCSILMYIQKRGA